MNTPRPADRQCHRFSAPLSGGRLPVWLCLASLLPLWLASSPAASAEVDLQVTDQPIQVAQPIWLELTVTAAAGAKINFPEPGEALGDFEVLQVRDIDDIPLAEDPQRRRWTRRFQIESLLAGPRRVPPLEVTVVATGGGDKTTLRTDPVTITVTSVLEERTDPTQFRDIDTVVDPPPTPPEANLRWLWWAGGLAAGVAVMAAAAVVWMRRTRRRWPTEWAVEQLSELESATERAEWEPDAALARMSEILETLAQRRAVQDDASDTSDATQPATGPAKTTEVTSFAEWIQHAASAGQVDAARTERVREALRTSDQARFAGRNLSREQTAAILRSVREWIVAQREAT
ncbi:hypothetical protein [Roseimaritima sediminicola]|uniref:hypothetical protein n=1 Tax=Roseimaritima sediminicola TaxID=2662066 RepID=UPI001298394F|nr:hypothetical protein [Roseimaritima sediminicola]